MNLYLMQKILKKFNKNVKKNSLKNKDKSEKDLVYSVLHPCQCLAMEKIKMQMVIIKEKIEGMDLTGKKEH